MPRPRLEIWHKPNRNRDGEPSSLLQKALGIGRVSKFNLHDTSVGQIESNYTKYITEHSDDHARTALLQLEEEPAAATDSVVPLVR